MSGVSRLPEPSRAARRRAVCRLLRPVRNDLGRGSRESFAVCLEACSKRVFLHQSNRAVGEGHVPEFFPVRLVTGLLLVVQDRVQVAKAEPPGDCFVTAALGGENQPSVDSGGQGFLAARTDEVLRSKIIGKSLREQLKGGDGAVRIVGKVSVPFVCVQHAECVEGFQVVGTCVRPRWSPSEPRHDDANYDAYDDTESQGGHDDMTELHRSILPAEEIRRTELF